MTPLVRLSYPAIFESRMPKNAKPGDKSRFSVTGLILHPDKMDEDEKKLFTALKGAIAQVGSDAMGESFRGLWENGKVKRPIHTDIKEQNFGSDLEDYGCYIRAWSYNAPGVVSIYQGPDGKAARVTDPTKIYPGVWARLLIRPWANKHSEGGWSIGLDLQGVQIVKDGDRLDGKINVADAFDALPPAAGFDISGGTPAASGGTSARDELESLIG